MKGKFHNEESSCDERLLAIKCARGDHSSQEELYRRYCGRILALCLRYSRDLPEAEDLMQDAFVKIFHKIGKYTYTGPGSLYAWMSRVAINLCFDSSKKRKKLAETLTEDISGFDVTDENDTGNLPDIPPDKLREMVEMLPEAYGTVFKLYVVDGLSHKEIGETLGIKESTSSSNLARAKAILIKRINEFVKQAEK